MCHKRTPTIHMRTGVDIRSLHTGKVSGVENYIVNVIEHLLQMDKQNQYYLLYNGFSKQDFSQFQFLNSQLVRKNIPNKFLNLSLKFLGRPKLEKLFGDYDVLFLPNANYAALEPDTKLAVTVHDLSPVVLPQYYDIKRRIWHWFLNLNRLYNRANVLFAVSEYTKQDLIRLFNVNPEKIKVIYPGINHKLFRPDLAVSDLRWIRNKYGLPGEFFLSINTIEPRKNYEKMIEAFEQLPDPIPLILGGKRGWNYRPIFKRIAKSPRRRLIRYIGYIPEEDKPYLIKLSQAIITPSIFEGFGFPALEGLAVGTPVLTSSVTSLPEVVGDAALLVNPHDAEEIARGMHALRTDTQLRTTLIEKGYAQAKKFTWESTARNILNELIKL